MEKRVKGESKASTVGTLSSLPLPEPNSVRRRRERAEKLPRTVWVGTAAEMRVKESGDLQAREYAKKRILRADKKTQIELYHPRSIDSAQKKAAERLKRSWVSSGMNARVVSAYESSPVGGNAMPGMGPTAVEYMRAMQAVGIILSPILTHVVIEDQSAESWAVSKGKPAKDGIAALRLALDALCEHYRFKPVAVS